VKKDLSGLASDEAFAPSNRVAAGGRCFERSASLLLVLTILLALIPETRGNAVPSRWGTVHSRALLVLHPGMAGFDCAVGRFFRSPNPPTAQGELLSSIQAAWKNNMPLMQRWHDAMGKLAYDKMKLLGSRDTTIRRLKNEAGNEPKRLAECRKKIAAEEAKVAQALLQNQQQSALVENELALAFDETLGSIYLTATESESRLLGFKREIAGLVVQTAREEGCQVVVDSSWGVPPFGINSRLPMVPCYPDTANSLQIQLFHWFQRWPPDPDAANMAYEPSRLPKEVVKASFNEGLISRFPDFSKRSDSLLKETSRFTAGSLFLVGQNDLTGQVARHLFARYHVPVEIQNSYMLFLRDFLTIDRPLGLQ